MAVRHRRLDPVHVEVMRGALETLRCAGCEPAVDALRGLDDLGDLMRYTRRFEEARTRAEHWKLAESIHDATLPRELRERAAFAVAGLADHKGCGLNWCVVDKGGGDRRYRTIAGRDPGRYAETSGEFTVVSEEMVRACLAPDWLSAQDPLAAWHRAIDLACERGDS